MWLNMPFTAVQAAYDSCMMVKKRHSMADDCKSAHLNSQSQDDVGAEGGDGEGSQVLDALSCEDLGPSLEPYWLLQKPTIQLLTTTSGLSFHHCSISVE